MMGKTKASADKATTKPTAAEDLANMLNSTPSTVAATQKKVCGLFQLQNTLTLSQSVSQTPKPSAVSAQSDATRKDSATQKV